MSRNRIKKLKALAETKFLNLYDAEFENRNQEEKHWIIASRKDFSTLEEQYFRKGKEKVDAVVIAALHKQSKRLVIIRQFRIPLNDYVYELPAGLIDCSENEWSTVSRELKEETGLELIEIKEHLSREKVYLSAGMTEESAAFVYCLCDGNITDEYLEPDEDIEALLISQKEAEKLLKTDVKVDVKAYMTLQSFVRLGERLFE